MASSAWHINKMGPPYRPNVWAWAQSCARACACVGGPGLSAAELSFTEIVSHLICSAAELSAVELLTADLSATELFSSVGDNSRAHS